MSFFVSVRYFFEFILFKIILFLLLPFSKKISLKIISNSFIFLGKLSKYNSIAKKNCKIVFPNLSEIEIENIINNSWRNLGCNLFEITFLNKLIKEKNRIQIKGKEIIEKIKKDKSPVIFFSIHSSNWEVCVPVLDHNGLNVGAIYRHINNNFFDRYIYKKRTKALNSKNSFYTPKGKVSANEILKGVISNKNIFLLVDQKDSAGTEINFFGKKVKTQTGFLKIARKYNLKIVPMKNIRLPNNNLQITFEEPLVHDKIEVSDEIKMLEINSVIERWIKENPDNWFWQHRRFS
jgi:KDO2-lipid IV(A) lauroyltransferase